MSDARAVGLLPYFCRRKILVKVTEREERIFAVQKLNLIDNYYAMFEIDYITNEAKKIDIMQNHNIFFKKSYSN